MHALRDKVTANNFKEAPVLPELEDWGEDSVAYREGEGMGIGLLAMILLAAIICVVVGAVARGCSG